MEKIILSENMINSISSQISASNIKEYININRIKYMRYLMNLIKYPVIEVIGGNKDD